MLYQKTIQTRWGTMVVTCDDETLFSVELGKAAQEDEHPLLSKTAQWFHEYEKGLRPQLKLPLAGLGTLWQRQVWQALLQIPYGETVSYGELARQLGQPRASRAVGQAVGRNPWLILVPCHRVIRGDGSLGGYREGIVMKRQLLVHEGAKP